MEEIQQKIIDFIRKETDGKSVVIGLSGGIDSALTASLAVKALGKDKIQALLLPSASNTRDEMKLAVLIANLLEIKYKILDIEKILQVYLENCDYFKTKLSVGNLKARIRMSLLYGLASTTKSMVVGTGNKSEIMIGYFTKYGDAGCDLLPIGDLYKTQVRALAKYMNIPQAIIDQAPTAGLWIGQTDENEIGILYEELDKILEAMENKKNLSNFNEAEVQLVQKYIKRTQHKRKMPKICKI
jgi:NAD+ synthase